MRRPLTSGTSKKVVALGILFGALVIICPPAGAVGWSSWNVRDAPALTNLATDSTNAIGALKSGQPSACARDFKRIGIESQKVATADVSPDSMLNHDIRVYAARGRDLSRVGLVFCAHPQVKTNQTRIKSTWGLFDYWQRTVTGRLDGDPNAI
jgi:hypothetical protein